MRFQLAVVLMCLLLGVWSSGSALADRPPELNRADIQPNTWVEISPAIKPLQQWSDVWYQPATDEFVMWGGPAAVRGGGRRYEVQSLSLHQPTPQWGDCLPPGKEKTWANGRFPGWGNAKNKPTDLPADFWNENAQDEVLGGFGKINRVSFVETDGVLRPTRVPTFHQGVKTSGC